MQDLKCISSVAEIGSMGQSLTGRFVLIKVSIFLWL